MIKFFRLFVSNILVYSYLWTSVYLLLLLVEGVTIIHSKRIIYLARMSVFFLILLLALRLANSKNVAGKKLSLPASWIRFMIIFVFFLTLTFYKWWNLPLAVFSMTFMESWVHMENLKTLTLNNQLENW